MERLDARISEVSCVPNNSLSFHESSLLASISLALASLPKHFFSPCRFNFLWAFPGPPSICFSWWFSSMLGASTLTSLWLPPRCLSPLHPLSQPHFQMSARLFSSISGRKLQVNVSRMEFVISYCPVLPRAPALASALASQLWHLLRPDGLTSGTSPLLLPFFPSQLPTPH